MRLRITGVIKYAGQWRRSGDILDDVPEAIGNQMIAQDVAEEVKKTPAEEEAVKAEAERKAAEKQLKALRKKAAELGIEGAADKDAETLVANIAAFEQK